MLVLTISTDIEYVQDVYWRLRARLLAENLAWPAIGQAEKVVLGRRVARQHFQLGGTFHLFRLRALNLGSVGRGQGFGKGCPALARISRTLHFGAARKVCAEVFLANSECDKICVIFLC